MFWQSATYAQPSPVEALLDKDAYTLEELLDEDEIIQEAKSLNGRLVDFLKQPETVSKLLSLIVEPPGASKAQAAPASPQAKRAFKFPYVACEIFCCEVDGILSTLVESEELMAQLFSILDQPRPLDCVLAGYFSRVVYAIFLQRPGESGSRAGDVMQHLQTHPGVLEKLVAHVENASIAEVLLRVLGADEFDGSGLQPLALSWMAQTPVLDALMGQLRPGAPLDAQQNAAYVLSGVARSHLTPLAQAVAAPDVLSQLLDQAFAPDVSVLALDICIALLERKSLLLDQEGRQGQSPPESPGLDLQSELDANIRVCAVQEMSRHLDRLREILEGGSVAEVRMLTPYGVLEPPLGTARLKAVEVVAALASTGLAQADEGLQRHGLLAACLGLFVAFPFNNLLHHLVTGIVCFLLEHGSAAALDCLLGECRLVPWLVGAPEEVRPAQPDPSRVGAPLRAGYLGHLTHIANRLAEAATSRDAVAAALGACPEWGDWVEGTLRSRNDTENVLMWTCGRPSKREVTSVSSVDELDAGGHMPHVRLGSRFVFGPAITLMPSNRR